LIYPGRGRIQDVPCERLGLGGADAEAAFSTSAQNLLLSLEFRQFIAMKSTTTPPCPNPISPLPNSPFSNPTTHPTPVSGRRSGYFSKSSDWSATLHAFIFSSTAFLSFKTFPTVDGGYFDRGVIRSRICNCYWTNKSGRNDPAWSTQRDRVNYC